MSLRRRAAVVVGAYIVVIVLVGAIVLPNLLVLLRTLQQEEGPVRTIQAQAALLAAAAVDQETGQRGYLITGDDEFLEPYVRGGIEAEQAIAALEQVDGIDELPGRLAAVRRALTAWQEGSAEPEIDARRRGLEREARRLVASGEGRARFDELRLRLDDLGALGDEVAESTRGRVEGAFQRLTAVLLLGFVAAMALTLVVRASLRRHLSEPVERLLDDVRRTRDEDLDSPVRSTGPTEIVEIADAIERLRGRLRAELDEVRRAQEALEQSGPVVLGLRDELAPSTPVLPPSCSVGASFSPAEGVLAGDFYDVRPVLGGRVALVVADVSGHGAAAGLLAVRIKYLLTAALDMALPPGDALRWVAERLGDTGERFATCAVVIVDPDDLVCEWANAGHPPVLARVGGQVVELAATGPLLGPIPGRWRTRSIQLASGSVLVGYTDGLTEARSASGEQFGVERLRAVVEEAATDAPEVVAERCAAAALAFSHGRARDDATIAVLSLHDQTAARTVGGS